jgi:hypothetical protein
MTTSQLSLDGIDFLECTKHISLQMSQGIVEAGTIFRTMDQALSAFNDPVRGMSLPDPFNKGKAIQVPLITEQDIYDLIEDGCITPRAYKDGQIVPTDLKLVAPTPVALGNSQVDENTGKETDLVAMPNKPGVKWGFHPDNLKGKSLDEYNALVAGKDPAYISEFGPFDDASEAVAFLSQDY